MKTTNAMQLKAIIKKKATDAGVSPQLILQSYLLERLIDRLSRSRWRDDVIVKGGMLIGSLLGIERRTTKDLDTTVRNLTLTHETAEEVFRDVCAVAVDDDIEFEFLRTEDIREIDEYPGIRVFLKAHYRPLAVPLTVDVTTGDRIVPDALAYDFPFAFDEGSARIMAYPLETVLAEKLETVLSRNVGNTRIRDFYDIHELWRTRGKHCDLETLGESLKATCEKRGSAEIVRSYEAGLAAIRESEFLTALWSSYLENHSYARGIGFVDACDSALHLMKVIDGRFE